MAQDTKEAPLDDKTIRSLMPAIDIKTLHLTGAQVLIYHEDQNKETKTAGGILMTDKTLEKARLDKITIGTIIAVGPQVLDPKIVPGSRALFFRQMSEGGIKGTDEKVYVLFNEYSLKGILPPEEPVSGIIGIA